jgi:hypothetical protein
MLRLRSASLLPVVGALKEEANDIVENGSEQHQYLSAGNMCCWPYNLHNSFVKKLCRICRTAAVRFVVIVRYLLCCHVQYAALCVWRQRMPKMSCDSINKLGSELFIVFCQAK